MASNAACVLQQDILHSISRIQQARTNVYTSQPVGVQQNQWQRPITEFGYCNQRWYIQMCWSPYVGNIDFDRSDWAESRQAVDEVMEWILKDLRSQAKNYKGLRIDSYVRQGSSREGLKVYKADEFDSMLEFHIEGLENRIEQTPIFRNGKIIPAFCYLTISGDFDLLQKVCPELMNEGIFEFSDGPIYLSSKFIHEKIFESMVDKAIQSLSKTIRDAKPWGHMAERFTLTRKMNPPAINVTIEMKFNGRPSKVIDLDLVPAYLLHYDRTTKYDGAVLNCPIHAICKWVDGEDLNQNLIWSAKSTGYEMHILDIARKDQRKLYILTALRIIKTYLVKTKQIAKEAGHPPPQLTTVLKSYHLRQIAFYAMYYLCHKHQNYRLDCVLPALAYVIGLLQSALNTKRLPHFFFSSRLAQDMLPGYPDRCDRHLRFNLFRKISNEALQRALQSLEENLMPHLGFTFGEIDDEKKSVFGEFELLLSTGDYF